MLKCLVRSSLRGPQTSAAMVPANIASPFSPQIFISYSHDSADHDKRVVTFAERLLTDGIEVVLDQFVEPGSPPHGWPQWMDRQIENADFVLIVCTKTYLRKVKGREQAGRGHGVLWEGNLIYQHIYNAGAQNSKFIPVLYIRA